MAGLAGAGHADGGTVTAFRRTFIQAAGLRIHYRSAGSGAPVVMLHPSPLSSQAVLPVASEVARHCEVFAPDTPGYGLSDPLPRRPRTLDEYLAPLAAMLDALGIGRCCLYGAATGAQIALEFACRHPERIELLVMDAAGHIPEARCRELVQGYFPDVAPRADGSHLLTLWGLVRDLGVFFPWNDARRGTRIERDLPAAAVMQAMLLDYLRAGSRYDWAYRSAFHNEHADRVARCRVPALLTRWPSSIALPITDALIGEGLPRNFEVLPLGPSMADRAAGIAAAVASRTAGLPVAEPRGTPAATSGFAGEIAAADGLQLHARVARAGSRRPLVALHGAGGAARLLESLLAPLAAARPVIALDLPGHGDGDQLQLLPGDLVTPLRAALDGLAVTDADLLGVGLGAGIAAALRQGEPARFGRFVAVDRSAPPGAPWPSLAPRLDGSHLLEAWFMLRDARLWLPWHERTVAAMRRAAEPDLDPAGLQAELVELMKCGEHYAAAAAREAAWRAAASDCAPGPTLILLDPDSTQATAPAGADEGVWLGATAETGEAIRTWLDG